MIAFRAGRVGRPRRALIAPEGEMQLLGHSQRLGCRPSGRIRGSAEAVRPYRCSAFILHLRAENIYSIENQCFILKNPHTNPTLEKKIINFENFSCERGGKTLSCCRNV